MKKIKTQAVKSWLPNFQGFYESIYEPDDEMEQEYADEQGFKGSVWEYFENRKYEQAVSREMCRQMEDALSDFVESITFEEVVSPKEYNFTTDSINCVIVVKIKAVRDYIYANKAAYEKYLERYNSRSGFISFYSSDFEDWKEYTHDFKDYNGGAAEALQSDKHYLGSVLEFICQNEKIDESDLWYYYGKPNCDSSEFYTYHTLLNPAITFAENNYTKPNLLPLMLSKFDTELIDVETIIRNVSVEIESHVMTIEFPEPKKKKK